LAGSRVLDIGAGTGAMARPMAARGARVVAADISAGLLATARSMATEGGVALAPVVAAAEALPFADASQAAVTASQCWHWFRREVAAEECYRVLAPGGHIVIVHFDWLPLPGNV